MMIYSSYLLHGHHRKFFHASANEKSKTYLIMFVNWHECWHHGITILCAVCPHKSLRGHKYLIHVVFSSVLNQSIDSIMTSNGMHWLRLPEWWMKPKMILNSLNDLLIWTSGQQEIRGKFVQHFKETINVVCQNMQNKWNSKQNPHYFIVILLTNTPKDNTTDIYTICVIWDT